MEKTHKDRVLSRLVKLGKKNKILKIPVMICISIIIGFFYVIQSIIGNTKKLISFACLLLFFFVGSSFASIGFVQTMDVTTGTVSDKEVPMDAETEVKAEDTEVIEDSDLIDGYTDSEITSSGADRYTVDEILDSNHEIGKSVTSGDWSNEAPVLSKDDWRLLLINKQHPVPDDYKFSLGSIKGSMQCDERIIGDLLLMLQGAKEDGINLVICSPYRDLSRQEVLFNKKITAYMKQGMSYMEAYKITAQAVTVPGASEHQVGLALDIICNTYSSLDEGFGETEAGKWLAEHSCEYGFILRYPQGKEYITSIEYEPWHFRYVGIEAATAITSQGITLEEFIENL